MNAAKFFICLASFMAFSVTFFTGMVAGSDFIAVLRDAAIACVVAAFVTRFFVQIIFNAIREAHLAHMDEVAADADEEEAEKTAESKDTRAASAATPPPAQEPVTQ